jgi:hypothetical protein
VPPKFPNFTQKLAENEVAVGPDVRWRYDPGVLDPVRTTAIDYASRISTSRR